MIKNTKYQYIFVIFLLFALTGCTKNEYTPIFPSSEYSNSSEESILPPSISDTETEPPVTQIENELSNIIKYFFIDIQTPNSITLPKSIQGYPLHYSYDTSFFMEETSYQLSVKKNGTSLLSASISYQAISVKTDVIVQVDNQRIVQTNQQNLIIKYLFLTRNFQKVGNAYTPSKLVIHNTANSASAYNEINYLNSTSNTSATSFHFAVDDNEIVQGIPLSHYAYHCGNYLLNSQSIGIEIAKSIISDNQLKNQAIENAARLIKLLNAYYNIPLNEIYTHKDASGKHCPHDIFDRYGLDNFLQLLK